MRRFLFQIRFRGGTPTCLFLPLWERNKETSLYSYNLYSYSFYLKLKTYLLAVNRTYSQCSRIVPVQFSVQIWGPCALKVAVKTMVCLESLCLTG